MRKFFVNSVVSFILLISISSVAQAQCLLCGVTGFMLGSAMSAGADPQSVSSAYGGAVIYIAPRISERLKEPLAVHIMASNVSGFSYNNRWSYPAQGWTIWQLFASSVPKPDQYVILEVMRVINPQNIDSAVFWFAYIEKEQLTPLDKLPALTSGQKK